MKRNTWRTVSFLDSLNEEVMASRRDPLLGLSLRTCMSVPEGRVHINQCHAFDSVLYAYVHETTYFRFILVINRPVGLQ